MPLLFRRAGSEFWVPSGLFSPGRSRMPRMFRMHARANPLHCRGNRAVRRLCSRAGCILSDTPCQNEHAHTVSERTRPHCVRTNTSRTLVRTSTFPWLALSGARSFLPGFALPIHGMVLPALLSCAPCLRASTTAPKAVAAIGFGEPPSNLHPKPRSRPEEPSPEECSCSDRASSPHGCRTDHTSV
jgi:hypothetical protein